MKIDKVKIRSYVFQSSQKSSTKGKEIFKERSSGRDEHYTDTYKNL